MGFYLLGEKAQGPMDGIANLQLSDNIELAMNEIIVLGFE